MSLFNASPRSRANDYLDALRTPREVGSGVAAAPADAPHPHATSVQGAAHDQDGFGSRGRGLGGRGGRDVGPPHIHRGGHSQAGATNEASQDAILPTISDGEDVAVAAPAAAGFRPLDRAAELRNAALDASSHAYFGGRGGQQGASEREAVFGTRGGLDAPAARQPPACSGHHRPRRIERRSTLHRLLTRRRAALPAWRRQAWHRDRPPSVAFVPSRATQLQVKTT
jgi:hypothetical protein